MALLARALAHLLCLIPPWTSMRRQVCTSVSVVCMYAVVWVNACIFVTWLRDVCHCTAAVLCSQLHG